MINDSLAVYAGYVLRKKQGMYSHWQIELPPSRSSHCVKVHQDGTRERKKVIRFREVASIEQAKETIHQERRNLWRICHKIENERRLASQIKTPTSTIFS